MVGYYWRTLLIPPHHHQPRLELRDWYVIHTHLVPLSRPSELHVKLPKHAEVEVAARKCLWLESNRTFTEATTMGDRHYPERCETEPQERAIP